MAKQGILSETFWAKVLLATEPKHQEILVMVSSLKFKACQLKKPSLVGFFLHQPPLLLLLLLQLICPKWEFLHFLKNLRHFNDGFFSPRNAIFLFLR